jgi:hypothetical protein
MPAARVATSMTAVISRFVMTAIVRTVVPSMALLMSLPIVATHSDWRCLGSDSCRWDSGIGDDGLGGWNWGYDDTRNGNDDRLLFDDGSRRINSKTASVCIGAGSVASEGLTHDCGDCCDARQAGSDAAGDHGCDAIHRTLPDCF